MTDSGVVQAINGSVPITNIQPPPEGQMAASLNVVLTPGNISFAQTFQLSSQNGLQLSQVVTLVIDNSANAYPLTVTHGVLSEVVQVAALSTVVVPTFSGKAGGYPLAIVAIENAVPSINLDIDVIFLNFPRPPGTFSATSQSTIIATGQNTGILYSGLVAIGLATGPVQLTTNGNFILDSIDMAVEGMLGHAAGVGSVPYQLRGGLSANPISVIIQSGQPVFTYPAAEWIQGGGINGPITRTWPQGLLLPRGVALWMVPVSLNNVDEIIFRINISGVNTP